MARYWMISDRNTVGKEGLGKNRAGLSYWLADRGPLDDFRVWNRVTELKFKSEILQVVSAMPAITDLEQHESQPHVMFFIHGDNTDWADTARRYGELCESLMPPAEELGLCILFSWPSDGMTLGYLPDREDARECAPDLADVFSSLYDWLLKRQADAARDSSNACKAKLSAIAHSMGNYLLQNAMQTVWTRKKSGLTASVAAHTGSRYTWSISSGTITAGQDTSRITFTAGSKGSVGLSATEISTAGCVSPTGTTAVSIGRR